MVKTCSEQKVSDARKTVLAGQLWAAAGGALPAKDCAKLLTALAKGETLFGLLFPATRALLERLLQAFLDRYESYKLLRKERDDLEIAQQAAKAEAERLQRETATLQAKFDAVVRQQQDDACVLEALRAEHLNRLEEMAQHDRQLQTLRLAYQDATKYVDDLSAIVKRLNPGPSAHSETPSSQNVPGGYGYINPIGVQLTEQRYRERRQIFIVEVSDERKERVVRFRAYALSRDVLDALLNNAAYRARVRAYLTASDVGLPPARDVEKLSYRVLCASVLKDLPALDPYLDN